MADTLVSRVSQKPTLSSLLQSQHILPGVQSQPELHRNLLVSLGYICENFCQEKKRAKLLSGKKH